MQPEQTLYFDPYQFDLQTLQLRQGQHEVKLTPKALAVLRILMM
jgi:DNA-binding winged helix-turn-helix (wHTH) protein